MVRVDQTIHIIADDREQKSEVIRSLLEIENIAVRIQRLAIGDYQVDSRVIVERKTLKDFALSIIDGRLFKQMIRLANSTLMGVLILEGTVNAASEPGVTREAMQGALITISLILGLPVLRAKDSAETAKLLVFMSRQINHLWNGGIKRHGYRPKSKRKRQLFMLQGLPGIGYERAVRLLDTFGSVEGVISASSEELQVVEGIGKKIAEKIKWVLGEQIIPYDNNEVLFDELR
jgi:DNA excision repair protein ERCC-4